MANVLVRSKVGTTSNKSVSWSAAVDRLKIQQRTCLAFISRESEKDLCVCNRPRSAHRGERIAEHPDKVWSWKVHTESIPTKYYGTLSQSNSPYLRCDIKTDLDQLCLMILGVWGMHVPKLILHIMSDSYSTLNVKLEEKLLTGISEAADASDACIITSCYKENAISQLIGEVIYKSRVKNPKISFRAIGVGKWGNIRDRPIENERFDSFELVQ